MNLVPLGEAETDLLPPRLIQSSNLFSFVIYHLLPTGQGNGIDGQTEQKA